MMLLYTFLMSLFLLILQSDARNIQPAMSVPQDHHDDTDVDFLTDAFHVVLRISESSTPPEIISLQEFFEVDNVLDVPTIVHVLVSPYYADKCKILYEHQKTLYDVFVQIVKVNLLKFIQPSVLLLTPMYPAQRQIIIDADTHAQLDREISRFVEQAFFYLIDPRPVETPYNLGDYIKNSRRGISILFKMGFKASSRQCLREKLNEEVEDLSSYYRVTIPDKMNEIINFLVDKYGT